MILANVKHAQGLRTTSFAWTGYCTRIAIRISHTTLTLCSSSQSPRILKHGTSTWRNGITPMRQKIPWVSHSVREIMFMQCVSWWPNAEQRYPLHHATFNRSVLTPKLVKESNYYDPYCSHCFSRGKGCTRSRQTHSDSISRSLSFGGYDYGYCCL